jgi:hypothetical protein
MNRIFKAVEVPEEEAMVEVFSGTNYTGYSVKLPVGTYTLPDLAVFGIMANDVESVKILKEGASARLYRNGNNSGVSQLVKADKKSLTISYKNAVNSITVEYEDPDGIVVPESIKNYEDVMVYSLDGKLLGRGKTAIHSNATKGKTVIVKTGDKSVKVKR